jgi:hypothetical protein
LKKRHLILTAFVALVGFAMSRIKKRYDVFVCVIVFGVSGLIIKIPENGRTPWSCMRKKQKIKNNR